MIKSFAIRVSSVVVAAVMMLAAAFVPTQNYDVRDPEECKLNFSILSDSHIETTDLQRYRVFNRCLLDVAKNESGNDAVIFLGDNTMNGQVLENMMFHGSVRLFLKDQKNILPVVGNHDIGNGEGDYEKLQNRWYAFTKAFFDKDLDHPYYSEVIDGYTFIVLGMEDQLVYDMMMTEAQFTWLEGVLAEAAKSDKPVFVFSHYPADDAIDETGESTDRLIDMLAEFNKEHDLIYFCGHTHMPMYLFWSFHDSDGFPEIYLPRLTDVGNEDNKSGVYNHSGTGVEVEVYGDRVIVRSRDFYRGEWRIESDGQVCEKTYELKNAEPKEEPEITPIPFPFLPIPGTEESPEAQPEAAPSQAVND